MKSKTRKILGIILQAPLVLMVIIAFFVTIYAAHNKISGITYGSTFVSGIIIVLYFIGVYLIARKKDDF